MTLSSLAAFHSFRARLDDALAGAWEQYQSQMQCKAGCFACCRNDFKISLVEALDVKTAVEKLATPLREKILQNKALPETSLCPLLVEGQCSIYASRPLLCRMFGFPVSNGNHIGTCELNFTDAQDQDFTAQCFDGPLIGKALQDLSRLYLKETGQTLPEEEETLPMFRIPDILESL